MGRGEKGEDGGKNLGPSSIGEGYSRIGEAQRRCFDCTLRFSREKFCSVFFHGILERAVQHNSAVPKNRADSNNKPSS